MGPVDLPKGAHHHGSHQNYDKLGGLGTISVQSQPDVPGSVPVFRRHISGPDVRLVYPSAVRRIVLCQLGCDSSGGETVAEKFPRSTNSIAVGYVAGFSQTRGLESRTRDPNSFSIYGKLQLKSDMSRMRVRPAAHFKIRQDYVPSARYWSRGPFGLDDSKGRIASERICLGCVP